jgi:hypothetical protein
MFSLEFNDATLSNLEQIYASSQQQPLQNLSHPKSNAVFDVAGTVSAWILLFPGKRYETFSRFPARLT